MSPVSSYLSYLTEPFDRVAQLFLAVSWQGQRLLKVKGISEILRELLGMGFICRGWKTIVLRLEAIAIGLEAIASR